MALRHDEARSHPGTVVRLYWTCHACPNNDVAEEHVVACPQVDGQLRELTALEILGGDPTYQLKPLAVLPEQRR